MATSKFQALWNHPAGPKTSKLKSLAATLLYLYSLGQTVLSRRDSDLSFLFLYVDTCLVPTKSNFTSIMIMINIGPVPSRQMFCVDDTLFNLFE